MSLLLHTHTQQHTDTFKRIDALRPDQTFENEMAQRLIVIDIVQNDTGLFITGHIVVELSNICQISVDITCLTKLNAELCDDYRI